MYGNTHKLYYGSNNLFDISITQHVHGNHKNQCNNISNAGCRCNVVWYNTMFQILRQWLQQNNSVSIQKRILYLALTHRSAVRARYGVTFARIFVYKIYHVITGPHYIAIQFQLSSTSFSKLPWPQNVVDFGWIKLFKKLVFSYIFAVWDLTSLTEAELPIHLCAINWWR